MKLVMVKGVHNTGKTTTVLGVIRELKKRGHTVGSIKDIHFAGYNPDEKGTDTYLHKEAGSEIVTGIGRDKGAMIFDKKIDMKDILPNYSQDYIVLEGDPGVKCPNIVTGASVADFNERKDENTIGFSGILGNEIKEYEGLPVFSNKNTRDIEKIVDLFESEAKDMKVAGEREVSLTFDGKEVELVPFVEDIIKGALIGIVKELKGYEDGAEVVIKLK